MGRVRHVPRRLHPHLRAAPPRRRRGDHPPHRRQRRLLHRSPPGLVLLGLRDLLHREGDRRRQAVPGARAADGVEVGGEPVLPPVALPAAAARPLRRAPGDGAPGEPPERGARLRRVGAAGPVGVARQPAVGHPVPRPPGADGLRVARRAHQLRLGARLRPRRGPPLRALLGRRRRHPRARHRQGHPALPRRLLARLPALRRPAAADHGVGPRLVAARRQEGLQVLRQRGAAGLPGAPLRAGRPALLHAPRDGLRPGRPVLRRGVHRPLQRRPRQRPGQHRVAGGDPVAARLRRHDAAGVVRRQPADRRRSRGGRRVPPRDGGLRLQPRPRRPLAPARRDQPVPGRARAVEAHEGGGRCEGGGARAVELPGSDAHRHRRAAAVHAADGAAGARRPRCAEAAGEPGRHGLGRPADRRPAARSRAPVPAHRQGRLGGGDAGRGRCRPQPAGRQREDRRP